MLERLSAAAPQSSLQRALTSPTDVGGVASFLSDLAPFDVDLSKVDPLAEAMARGVRIKQELLDEAGGGMSSSQVAGALGITRQAVDKRRSRGSLLGVPTGSGEFLYPACQFQSDGVTSGLEEVLQSFQVEDPWTRLSLLLSSAPSLRGKTLLQAIQNGKVTQAVAVASAFGEQGG